MICENWDIIFNLIFKINKYTNINLKTKYKFRINSKDKIW